MHEQMSDKPRVFVFAPVYWPGYKSGGPVRTLRNLVSRLRDEISFHVFTSDRDHGDRRPYPTVDVDQWNDVDGVPVFYGSTASRRITSLCRIVNQARPDVVYVNSFFNPGFSIRPALLHRAGLLGRHARWVIATRGEFAPAALALKAWKKRPWLTLARVAGVHRGFRWQATSEFEAGDIAVAMGIPRDRIALVPNMADGNSVVQRRRERRPPGKPLQACFLSRITPMKNLCFALESLALVREPVDFHVYGPIADERYWQECRRAFPSSDGPVTVTVHGEVPSESVREVLSRHDLFVLPTRGENFGHAVFEALAAGVPVLLSDRTPWQDLDARGVGWVRPIDEPRRFAEVIKSCAALTEPEREAMSERATRYAAEVADRHDVVERTRALFMPDIVTP